MHCRQNSMCNNSLSKTVARCLLAALGLAMMLTPIPARAERPEAALWLEDGRTVELTAAEREPGAVRLEISGLPDGEEWLLLDPQLDGLPACFASGWGTEPVEPGPDGLAVIELQADDPDAVPGEAALRFLCAGRASTPLGLRFTDSGAEVTPASFLEKAREPSLLDSDVDDARPEGPLYRAFSDVPPPEVADTATSVVARTCLRLTDEAGERLLLVTQTDAALEGGVARAECVDAALLLQDETPCIVSARAGAENGLVLTSEDVALIGDVVYGAALHIRVDVTDGAAPRASAAVTSRELGGECGNLPLALFETARAGAMTWDLVQDENGRRLVTCPGATADLPLTAPLRVKLASAQTLGELVVCFEYWLPDGYSWLSALMPWEAGEVVD